MVTRSKIEQEANVYQKKGRISPRAHATSKYPINSLNMLEINHEVSKMKTRWAQLNWRDITKRVYRIQKQIYRRTLKGESVHKLQNVLTNLFDAKLLAVRRVTQDNKGKKTAGVDKVKNLSPTKRWELAKHIRIDGQSDKVRRVWIPKANSTELRPLGIPTIKDRAKQALVLLALEPEWEARFEPNNYGFRPGRSAHDAIEAIHSSINKKPKYVLDADIRKCFDRINHDFLLSKLNTYPNMQRQVKAWLKAGIIDGAGETLFPEAGTPQGGVLSPLLANVALHGLEDMLGEWIQSIRAYNPGGTILSKSGRRSRLTVVRYADDFIVLHPELERIQEAKKKISEWLLPIGLELHPEKTCLRHTLYTYEGIRPGFKFLGFWIRNYLVGTPEEGKRKSGYKTYFRPHPDSISKVFREIRKVLRRTRDVRILVRTLNPIIKGWSNYYRTVASKNTFTSMDKKLMEILMKWARRKHPRQRREWVRNRYLHRSTYGGRNRQRFGIAIEKPLLKRKSSAPNTACVDIKPSTQLQYFAETAIVRCTKVAGRSSPYDGNWIYWVLRRRDIADRRLSLQNLIQRQKGRCTYCSLYFSPLDLIEVDHINPKKEGGKDHYDNLQALHLHCHDQKEAK